MFGLKELWALLRKVDQLFALDAKHDQAIDEIQAKLSQIEERLMALEHRADLILIEAKSAARAGAQDSMQGTMAEVSRRITLLEVATAPRERLKKPRYQPK